MTRETLQEELLRLKAELGKTVVLVTHDHDDHLGDAFPICKRSGATLVAMFEIAMAAQEEGISAEPMGIGGAISADDLIINMVNAQHSAGLGHPAGFVSGRPVSGIR